MEKTIKEKQTNYLLQAACLVILVAGIREVSHLLNIFLLSILIAQCTDPIVRRIQQAGISVSLAIFSTILLIFFMGFGVITVLGEAVVAMKAQLPQYVQKIDEMMQNAQTFFDERGIDVSNIKLVAEADSSKISAIMKTALVSVGQMIGNTLFVFILTVFILVEFARIRKKIKKQQYEPDSFMYKIERLNQTSSRYFGIIAWTGLIQAVLSASVLIFLKVDFALTLGILFFFCNFIPAIGFFLALIPVFVIALLSGGWETALIAVVSWEVINMVFESVVKPKYMKKAFAMSELIVFLSFMFWSYVLGLVGALVAIPLTTTLVMLYKSLILEEELPSSK